MRHSALALFLAVIPASSMADEPPPVPDGGLTHYENKECTDPVMGTTGRCFYSLDRFNNRYMAFFTPGNLCMYIEQEIDGVYVEIWRRQPDV